MANVKQLPSITRHCLWKYQDIAVRLKFFIYMFIYFWFLKDMTKIKNCLLRPPSRGEYRRVSFPRKKKEIEDFEP